MTCPKRVAWLSSKVRVTTQALCMRSTLASAGKPAFFRRPELPDLGSQLEELMIEVWRQEEFERKHPFTCAVIRETAHSRPASWPQLN